MKYKSIIFLFISSILLSSCVNNSLNSYQKNKLVALKQQNQGNYIEEKKVGLAITLGLLPGGGSFYTRHPVAGVLNLLTWPVSILWDPFNGYNASQEINYYASVNHLKRVEKLELDNLEDQFVQKQISEKFYFVEKSRIKKKYDLDYIE